MIYKVKMITALECFQGGFCCLFLRKKYTRFIVTEKGFIAFYCVLLWPNHDSHLQLHKQYNSSHYNEV